MILENFHGVHVALEKLKKMEPEIDRLLEQIPPFPDLVRGLLESLG